LIYAFPPRRALRAHRFVVAGEFPSYDTTTVRADYAELIGRGAYPDAHGLPAPGADGWTPTWTGIVRRDLGELRREVDPARAEALLRVLAARQARHRTEASGTEICAMPPDGAISSGLTTMPKLRHSDLTRGAKVD
jgi:hypothetical protein